MMDDSFAYERVLMDAILKIASDKGFVTLGEVLMVTATTQTILDAESLMQKLVDLDYFHKTKSFRWDLGGNINKESFLDSLNDGVTAQKVEMDLDKLQSVNQRTD